MFSMQVKVIENANTLSTGYPDTPSLNDCSTPILPQYCAQQRSYTHLIDRISNPSAQNEISFKYKVVTVLALTALAVGGCYLINQELKKRAFEALIKEIGNPRGFYYCNISNIWGEYCSWGEDFPWWELQPPVEEEIPLNLTIGTFPMAKMNILG